MASMSFQNDVQPSLEDCGGPFWAHDAGHIRHFQRRVSVPGVHPMTRSSLDSPTRDTTPARNPARGSQADRSQRRGVALAGVLARRDARPIP